MHGNLAHKSSLNGDTRKRAASVAHANGDFPHSGFEQVGASPTQMGEIIRRTRTMLDIEQKQFAEEIKISHGLLSQIENGVASQPEKYIPVAVRNLRRRVARKMRELGTALEEIA